MTLMQTHHFSVRKSFLCNCFNLSNYLNYMRDIIIYVARWWEKYLSKRSLHDVINLLYPTWRDKLIVLWILNRQAKTFLRIPGLYLLPFLRENQQRGWNYSPLTQSIVNLWNCISKICHGVFKWNINLIILFRPLLSLKNLLISKTPNWKTGLTLLTVFRSVLILKTAWLLRYLFFCFVLTT